MSDREEDEELENRADPNAVARSEKEIITTLLSSSSVSIKDLVPDGPLQSSSAVKVARWILTSSAKRRNENFINQRLKWLTAVVQYGIVDSLTELQQLFNPLIQLTCIAKHHAITCHLLYMIATTKIYKFQVERIMKNANVLGLTKPLAGLLSRIKALRPDLVPQTIPHQSSAVSFPKAPPALRKGLYELSERIRENNELPNINNLNQFIDEQQKPASKKIKLDILPRVQHINLKSSFEVDFQKLVLLTQFQTFDALVNKITTVELPNHVGSLLSKREYHYVLALNFTPHMEALLSQWLYMTLYHEFLEKSQVVGKEAKVFLLNQIIEFQQSTGRKLMVVYDFLSEYLETWDGIQYSDQIHQLLAEAPFLPYTDLYDLFLRVLEEHFHFSPPSTRIKIINTCRLLINNLLLQKFGASSNKQKRLFRKASPESAPQLVEGVYVVCEVIRFTERLLNMALLSSNNVSLVFNSLFFYTWLIEIESEFHLPFRTFCQPITVYMALFSPSPTCIALLCNLICKYTKLGKDELMGMTVIEELQEFLQDAQENATLLNRYIRDVSSCLINEKAFVGGSQSLLSFVPKKTRRHLATLGDYQAAFHLKKHPAFMGVAHEWIKSKSDNESDSLVTEPLQVLQEIDADSEGYFEYLLGHFPPIRDYLHQFCKP